MMANNGFMNSITNIAFILLLFTVLTGKAFDLSTYLSEFQQGFIYGMIVASIIFVRRREFKVQLRSLLGGKNE